jgi:hypothetical protein
LEKLGVILLKVFLSDREMSCRLLALFGQILGTFEDSRDVHLKVVRELSFECAVLGIDIVLKKVNFSISMKFFLTSLQK